MNNQQIQEISIYVEKYFDMVTPDVLTGDQVNSLLENGDLYQKANQVFSILKEELTKSYLKILPFKIISTAELMKGNESEDITHYLVNVHNNVFSKKLDQPYPKACLVGLISYLSQYGLWVSKTEHENFLINEKESLEIAKDHLESTNNEYKKIIAELKKDKLDLSQFVKAKSAEWDEIENLIQASRKIESEINTIHVQSAQTGEKINSLQNNAQNSLKKIDETFNSVNSQARVVENVQKSISETFDIESAELVGLKCEYKENLDFVAGKTDYFREQNQVLDDLITKKVGESLYKTFEKRKIELATPVKFWGTMVAFASVLAVVWIFILFGKGTGLSWQVMVVNSLKTLPALGLLVFTITQYTKERHFQEEYAFKSAAALTVNAYAKQIKGDDNKDKLILDSVGGIYKSPVHTKIKEPKLKSILDVANVLKEVKGVLETATKDTDKKTEDNKEKSEEKK